MVTAALAYMSWRWSVIALALVCAAMAVVVWVLLKPADAAADRSARAATAPVAGAR